jgi:hypothetical protein
MVARARASLWTLGSSSASKELTSTGFGRILGVAGVFETVGEASATGGAGFAYQQQNEEEL